MGHASGTTALQACVQNSAFFCRSFSAPPTHACSPSSSGPASQILSNKGSAKSFIRSLFASNLQLLPLEFTSSGTSKMAMRYERPSSVKLASVKHELYHPHLPTLRRMDMDNTTHKLPTEHSRTTTTCSRGIRNTKGSYPNLKHTDDVLSKSL